MPRGKTKEKSSSKASTRSSAKRKVSSQRRKTDISKKRTTKPKKTRKTVSSKKEQEKKIKYVEKTGTRKTSTARVRLHETEEEKGRIIINKKDFTEYFPVLDLQKTILAPIEKTENFILNKGKIEILVKGGGKRGQAEAIQLGIARLILEVEPKYKTILKSNRLLRRDPRMVERKKFGFKKARRAPQWQKR